MKCNEILCEMKEPAEKKKATIRPAVTYGSECWSIGEEISTQTILSLDEDVEMGKQK